MKFAECSFYPGINYQLSSKLQQTLRGGIVFSFFSYVYHTFLKRCCMIAYHCLKWLPSWLFLLHLIYCLVKALVRKVILRCFLFDDFCIFLALVAKELKWCKLSIYGYYYEVTIHPFVYDTPELSKTFC